MNKLILNRRRITLPKSISLTESVALGFSSCTQTTFIPTVLFLSGLIMPGELCYEVAGGCDKYIERLFVCLHKRFGILRPKVYKWSDEDVILIRNVFDILHNTIVKIHVYGDLSKKLDEEGAPLCDRVLPRSNFAPQELMTVWKGLSAVTSGTNEMKKPSKIIARKSSNFSAHFSETANESIQLFQVKAHGEVSCTITSVFLFCTFLFRRAGLPSANIGCNQKCRRVIGFS